MIKNMFFAMAVLVISACSPECTNPNPFVDYDSQVDVERIVDGDTFTILIKGEEFSVRVLNLDCFETKHNSRLTDQAAKAGISEDSAYVLGHLAKSFADSMLKGQRVTIKRDSAEADFDVYGRLLRILFVRDMLYESLIKAKGLAVPD
jgi:micrococcal nuclease